MIETSAFLEIEALEHDGDGLVRMPNSNVCLVAALHAIVLSVLWLAGQGPLLRIAIPTLATFLGLILYLRRPVLYVQYLLWIWFLTPLLRRMVDWRFGWEDPNIILLAPLLVSGIAGLAFLRKGSAARREIPAGFVLCGVAIFYGFVVGMFLHPSAETAYELLNWLCPLLFGLHLFIHWRHYEQYRDAILRTFLWGVLVLGIYGVYQFLAPAGWDCLWLENVIANGTGVSFGLPDSLLVRVFSTLNSPGPFANMMMVGVLFLFVTRSSLKPAAAIAGYTSFLLSMVRTAWLSWIVGLLWILKSCRPRVMIRLVISIALLVAGLAPLLSDPRLADVIGDRMKTFTDLGHDDSYGARMEMYRILTADAIDNPFGYGLKNLEVSHGVGVDSGILAAVFSLGWLGAVLFGAGVLSLFFRKTPSAASDEFSQVGRAIMLAILLQIIGGNVFIGVNGILFWMSVGICLAAGKSHAASNTGLIAAEVY
jgi:hypothetical protein